MITYSTNMMGPVSMEWFRERGLTEIVSEVLEEDHKFSGLKKGQIFDFENITTYYCCGRIDIRGVPGDEYWNGWHEYSLAPMHGEDWNHLSEWLQDFESQKLWEFDDLIAHYEDVSERKIRWADDIWFKCHECGLVTDLRENKDHLHKMSCSRNWKEWKPGMKPHWEYAPEWAQYLTQDRDGTWTWWENKPEYDDGDWSAKNGRGLHLLVTENKFLTWTVADNSLEERPQ